jgi:nucleotide-binding universal stress UspA family protein
MSIHEGLTQDGSTNRPPARPTHDDIVVGIDGSAPSAAALLWAAEQALATNRRLRLVHTWQLSAAAAAALTSGAGDYIEAATADARARATRWVLDVLGGTAAGVRWTLEVHEGAPGPVLVDRSREARMLVVGTREHTGLRRALSGSVSHYALAHAEVPVIAVPASPSDPPRDTDRDAMVLGPLL